MIHVTSLTKRYGSKVAVDNLSFDVHGGRVTGFLGPNGSGKSTTLRVIVGLDAPNVGRALVNGRRYADLASPLRQIGVMLDGRACHPGRSARAHLGALARSNDIPTRRVDAVLETVGLADVASRRVGTFSLGMSQRLGIAAALIGDPGVLLLDEPINGLDPEGIRWVRDLVRGLASEGRCVLISSHLICDMAVSADALVVIGRGRLLAEMSMATFIALRPGTVRVRASDPDPLVTALEAIGAAVVRGEDGGLLMVSGATAGTIAELATAKCISLHELTPQTASLEDVFMELTRDSVDYRGTPQQVADSSNLRSC
ncbi:MAG TPA: ATP-binding cassette domain-containing protein [Candidatus Dormibacteraeota bacterium]